MSPKSREWDKNHEIMKKLYLLGVVFNYFRNSLLPFFKGVFMNIINHRLIQAMHPSSSVFCCLWQRQEELHVSLAFSSSIPLAFSTLPEMSAGTALCNPLSSCLQVWCLCICLIRFSSWWYRLPSPTSCRWKIQMFAVCLQKYFIYLAAAPGIKVWAKKHRCNNKKILVRYWVWKIHDSWACPLIQKVNCITCSPAVNCLTLT